MDILSTIATVVGTVATIVIGYLTYSRSQSANTSPESIGQPPQTSTSSKDQEFVEQFKEDVRTDTQQTIVAVLQDRDNLIRTTWYKILPLFLVLAVLFGLIPSVLTSFGYEQLATALAMILGIGILVVVISFFAARTVTKEKEEYALSLMNSMMDDEVFLIKLEEGLRKAFLGKKLPMDRVPGKLRDSVVERIKNDIL